MRIAQLVSNCGISRSTVAKEAVETGPSPSVPGYARESGGTIWL